MFESYMRMSSLAFKHLPLAILLMNASLLVGGQKIWAEEKTNLVFVANEDSASISVIDGAAKEVTSTLQVDEGPHNLALSPDRRFLLVTHPSRDKVTIIETKARRVRSAFPFQGKPHGVAFAPDGRSAYLALEGGSSCWSSSQRVG